MPMNSNQIVSNSLAEALQNFQRAVAPLLKLGKISEWNGTILKKREEKIREAALILGGKSIAILLEKLASLRDQGIVTEEEFLLKKKQIIDL